MNASKRHLICAKIAKAIADHPSGKARSGFVPVRILQRTGLADATVRRYVTHEGVCELLGVSKILYLPDASGKSLGTIQLVQKAEPLAEETREQEIARVLKRYHDACDRRAAADREYFEARAEAMAFAGKGIDPEEFA